MDSAGFLPRANETCEWMWKIYRKFAIAFFFSMAFSVIFSVLFDCFMNDNLDAAQLYRPVGMMYVIL